MHWITAITLVWRKVYGVWDSPMISYRAHGFLNEARSGFSYSILVIKINTFFSCFGLDALPIREIQNIAGLVF